MPYGSIVKPSRVSEYSYSYVLTNPATSVSYSGYSLGPPLLSIMRSGTNSTPVVVGSRTVTRWRTRQIRVFDGYKTVSWRKTVRVRLPSGRWVKRFQSFTRLVPKYKKKTILYSKTKSFPTKKYLLLRSNRLSFRSVANAGVENKLTSQYTLNTGGRKGYGAVTCAAGVGISSVPPHNFPMTFNWGLLNPDNYSVPQSMHDEAIRKLYAKASSDLPNYAQAIAERNKSKASIADSILKLCSLLLAIKRGNLRKAADIVGLNDAKTLASNVLLFQYGVRPLMMDIAGAVDDLNSVASQETTVKLTGTSKLKLQRVVANVNGLQNIISGYTINESDDILVRYTVYAKVKTDPYTKLAVRGLTNISSLVWELLPWSFIIDWIFNIGSFLATKDALANYNYIDAHYTIVRKTVRSASLRLGLQRKDAFGDNGSYSSSASAIARVTTNVERYPLTVLPALPGPVYKNRVNLEKSLNAIALLVTLLKR
jgi:hypothetical protein